MFDLLHILICLVAAYASFCRIVKMNHRTRHGIRFSVIALGGSAIGYAFAPWLLHFSISGIAVLFEASVASLLIASSNLWKYGAPEQFRR